MGLILIELRKDNNIDHAAASDDNVLTSGEYDKVAPHNTATYDVATGRPQ